MEVNIIEDRIKVHELYEKVSKSGVGSVSLFVGNKKDIFEKSVLGTVTGDSRNEVIKSFLMEVCTEVRKKYNVLNIIIDCWLEATVDEPCLAIASLASTYQHATEAVSAAVDFINGSKPKFDSDNPVIDIVPADMIQVKASCAEIKQRIQSFIERQREQLNVDNIRDFCYRKSSDETSCARVDAVKIHRKDSRSHLRVSKVFNSWGPQTVRPAVRKPDSKLKDVSTSKQKCDVAMTEMSESICSSSHTSPHDCKRTFVEERIRNIEDHVGLSENSSSEVYARLKKIEDKILYLEGLSPEYFEFGVNNSRTLPNSSDVSVVKRSYSVHELSNKIKELECNMQIGREKNIL